MAKSSPRGFHPDDASAYAGSLEAGAIFTSFLLEITGFRVKSEPTTVLYTRYEMINQPFRN